VSDRVLGMLGGMAWPSTAAAYAHVNETVAEKRGGRDNAELLLWSADFARVEALQAVGDWAAAGDMLADAAARLEAAGAGALVLLTNTMHRVAPAIEAAVAIPLLHVADATVAAAGDAHVLGLLGTRFTMEEEGVRDRLEAHGREVLVPDAELRQRVHDHIYNELVHGRVTNACKAAMKDAAAALVDRGAEAVVAGCTEIELALAADDVDARYVPTTAALMDAAVGWLLEGAVPSRPEDTTG